MSAMLKRLIIVFAALTVPVVVFFLIVVYVHRQEMAVAPPLFPIWSWGVVLMVLSVMCGIALPILMRTIFHAGALRDKKVDLHQYQKLQTGMIVVSLAGAYTACLAYLFLVPTLHLYASVLAGLYGIYSAIPVRRKLSADLKYYGLKIPE